MTEHDADTTGKRDLNAAVAAHYAAQHLPEARAERILTTTDLHNHGERRWLRRMVAAVALVVVVLGAAHITLDRRDLTQGVLREVALNHREDHGADVRASSYAALVSGLSRLELPTSLPVSVGDSVAVLGGRYCSVRGNLAAKLMLREAGSGRELSLFATPSTAALARIGEVTTEADGVKVRLWTEGEVFYALARGS